MGYRLQGNKFVFDDEPSQEMWNTLGGNTGSANDNFFTKKASSIGNAIGTTLSAPISDFRSGGVFFKGTENIATENLLRDNKTRMNDIAKKYGYNTYQDVWDARDKAEEEGDQATLDLINNKINPELQSQANANAKLADDKAAAYKDYRENNLISKNINQDRGKFLGSAMNTLSTAADVGLMAAGIPSGAVFNAGQGAFEGVADELEQNGLENFDWGRAGQNAAIGAASGAVTGALNKTGLMRNLGQGKISQAVLGSKLGEKVLNNGLGRAAQAVGTGAVKGAISGAVGGATGAGLSAAMNNQDVLGGALQGAMKGAQGGAMTGGIMAGANLATNAALNKIAPNTMEKVRANQARNAELGDTIREQWKNARGEDTWGNRAIDNAKSLVNRVNENGAMSIKNVGNEVPEVLPPTNSNNNINEPQPTSVENQTAIDNNAWDELAKEKGFKDFNELQQKFYEANPRTRADAGDVLDWADKNTGSITKAMVENEVVPSKASKETKLRNAQGKELLKQYGAVDQPMARATRAAETFQELSDMGFTKPGDVERMSNAITGSNGAVSKLNNSIIESAKPVNTFDGETSGQTIEDFIDRRIEKNYLSGTNEGKAVKRGIMAYLNALPSRADGSIGFEDSAADTFKLVQQLESGSAELKGRGGSTYHRANTADLHQAQVIDDVANLLKDRIYSGADVKMAVTPEVVANLKALDPGNKSWEKTVDNFAANAKSPKDVRSFQRPFVRANKYIENQYIQAATVGGRMVNGMSSSVPTTKAGLVKEVVNNVWNSNPAVRLKAKALGYAADKVAANNPTNTNTVSSTTPNAPTPTGDTTIETPTSATTNNTYNPSTQVYNAIGRTEGAINRDNERAAQYLTEVAQEAETVPNTLEGLVSPSATNTSNGTNSGATSVYNSVYGTQAAPGFNSLAEERKVYFFRPTGDEWTDMLSRAMRRAKNAEDYEALDSLYEMYQDAVAKNEKANSSSEVKLTDKQRQANAAQRALDDFETEESNFAYDVSDIPVLGQIANIGGNTYASKAEALALQVGYMLSGATVNAEEARKIGMAYVPQPRDNEATRRSKLAQLRGIISDYQQTYQS